MPDSVHELMQIVGCRQRVSVSPQAVSHDVPMQPMPGREGEQFHKCLGFAQPPAIGDRSAGDGDGEATQQAMLVSAAEAVLSPIGASSRARAEDERRFLG